MSVIGQGQTGQTRRGGRRGVQHLALALFLGPVLREETQEAQEAHVPRPSTPKYLSWIGTLVLGGVTPLHLGFHRPPTG